MHKIIPVKKEFLLLCLEVSYHQYNPFVFYINMCCVCGGGGIEATLQSLNGCQDLAYVTEMKHTT